MASTRGASIPLVLTAFAALALAPGCFMTEAGIKINVDGSADVELQVGALAALLDMDESEEDPFAELREDLPEGWTARPLELEGWRGVVVSGRAPAGEALLPSPEEAPMDIKLTITRRLLSTEYVVDGVLVMPEPGRAMEEETIEEAAAGTVVFTQLPEMPADENGDEMEMDPGAFMDLLGAMSQPPRMSFRIQAPGTIIETTGQVSPEGAAVWALDLSQMMEQEEPPEIRVYLKTRLLNHQNIGRLADRLAAEADMADMTALIGLYVGRGLLPNPVREDPLRAALDAQAYAAALEITARLDEAVGPTAAARIINGLRLNQEGVTSRQLQDMRDLLVNTEEDELIEVVAQALIRHLQVRGR